MTTFQLTMGAVSVALTVVAYAVYLRQTLSTTGVAPHPFSWLLWSLVTGVAYEIQVTQGAGAGSWVTGLTSIICLLIALASFYRNKWNFTLSDWASLSMGILVLLYYLASKEPVHSAILATLADTIGYAPTVRKGWSNPRGDSVTSFCLNSIKFLPAILSLTVWTISTGLYPSALLILNGGVAVMLVMRRQHLAAQESK